MLINLLIFNKNKYYKIFVVIYVIIDLLYNDLYLISFINIITHKILSSKLFQILL
jgi:hypothetical protein